MPQPQPSTQSSKSISLLRGIDIILIFIVADRYEHKLICVGQSRNEQCVVLDEKQAGESEMEMERGKVVA